MDVKRSTADWAFEAVAFAGVVAGFAVIGAYWSELPGSVPRHFGVSGAVDRWGDKSGLWVLPCVAFGIYVVLTVIAQHQQFINLPFQVDRSSAEVRKLLLSMTVCLKAVMAVLFAYIAWGIVQTALQRSHGLGRFFLFLLLTATALPIVGYLLKLRHYRT